MAAERVNRASSGMIQQIALARALLGNPALVLLDEPTRSLDAEAPQAPLGCDRAEAASRSPDRHAPRGGPNRCDGRVDFPT